MAQKEKGTKDIMPRSGRGNIKTLSKVLKQISVVDCNSSSVVLSPLELSSNYKAQGERCTLDPFDLLKCLHLSFTFYKILDYYMDLKG